MDQQDAVGHAWRLAHCIYNRKNDAITEEIRTALFDLIEREDSAEDVKEGFKDWLTYFVKGLDARLNKNLWDLVDITNTDQIDINYLSDLVIEKEQGLTIAQTLHLEHALLWWFGDNKAEEKALDRIKESEEDSAKKIVKAADWIKNFKINHDDWITNTAKLKTAKADYMFVAQLWLGLIDRDALDQYNLITAGFTNKKIRTESRKEA